MLRPVVRNLVFLAVLALLPVACGGGGGGGGGGGNPPVNPPSITIDSQETDANGDATVSIGGQSLTLTFVDDLTDEPIEGLFVDVVENDVDSILVVSDGFGEFATYGELIDPASFPKSNKVGLGRRSGPSYVSDGIFGVPYVDDLMVGVPGVLSYVNPELWDAWLQEFADVDGSPSLAALNAWLVDLVQAEATAEVVQVIAAQALATPGFDDTWALLSGAATVDEIETTPWLSVWSDWYLRSCYDGGAAITVYVTLYEGLLTIFLWPEEAPPTAVTETFASIQGLVFDAETREPIADAAVVPAHQFIEGVTDASGLYSLSDVSVVCDAYGEVVFVVEALGYFPFGFTGIEAGLNGTSTAFFDVYLQPAIPWTFYGPAQFAPSGTWTLGTGFGWSGTELVWNVDPTLTAAYDLLDAPLDVAAGDRIELEYRYIGHADPNSRQKVPCGFTDARDVSGGWPANFIGLSTTNLAGSARTDVMFANGGAPIVPFGITHPQDAPTTIRMLVIVLSTSEYRLVVDKDDIQQFNQVLPGNLVGTLLDQCAVWNAPSGVDPIEGAYEGALVSVRWRGLVN